MLKDFHIAITFAFSSTCDLLLVISVKSKESFSENSCDICNKQLTSHKMLCTALH